MSPPLSEEQARSVERHTALVAKLARAVARGGATISVEELESVGNEALVRCAMRYRPETGASFATYAHYRVRGAMIDAIRKRSPGRRRQQRALARLEATQALLSEAADGEAARRSSGQRQTLEQRVEAATALVRKAAIAIQLSEPDSRRLAEVEAGEPDPETELVRADTREQLWSLVDQLDPEQRALVEAIYVEGQTMRQLATELGISVATVSRRHARIIDSLGKRARARGL